jgi:protein SCO1
MQRRNLLFSALLLPGTLGLALVIGWWQVDGPGAAPEIGQRPLPLTNMSFALTDHEGGPVGPETLIGQPSILFFGFTFCPDVCPTTLSDISGWLDDLGAEAEQLNTVFITVDPERDTVDVMAEYVGYFHPAIRAWTGSEAEIAKAAEGFRASYERVPAESGGYTMNHAASVFLFDAAGRFVSTIDYHEPREIAVPKIRRAMNGQGAGGA